MKIYFAKEKGAIDQERLNRQITNACQLLANGQYNLTITRYVKHRSNNQNRLLMLWCNCIAKYLRDNADCQVTGGDVKEIMKQKFLPIDTPIGKGSRHTSKLNTEEFTDLLNNIQAYFETISGVQLPMPDDMWWDEFERQFDY